MRTDASRLFALTTSLLALALTLACFAPVEPRPDLSFEPASLADARVGVPYEATITVRGNVTPVFLFSVEKKNLPEGLTWEYHEHDDFARIKGTPTRAGTFTFQVSASCLGTNVSGQSGQAQYTLEVH
jgi:hypothetical protein